MVETEDETTGEIHKAIKRRFMLRYYTVFNIEQTDLEIEKYVTLAEHKPSMTAEELLHRREPSITHGGGRACYSPIEDKISLPAPETFRSPDEYYRTGYHELTHWTGHKSRLDRLEPAWHGSETYSLEELVAEIGSNMLAYEAGIAQDVSDNSQAYINHWLKVLRGDSKAIIKASGRAQKAYDFCLNGHEAEAEEPEQVITKPEYIIEIPEPDREPVLVS